MPSMNEVIERVHRITPNAIDDKDLGRWLITLDGRIYEELIKADAPEQKPVHAFPDDGDKPLLAVGPYDNIYDLYLASMVYFSLGEYSDYNNVVEQFDKTLRDFKAWWRKNHVPKQNAGIRGV